MGNYKGNRIVWVDGLWHMIDFIGTGWVWTVCDIRVAYVGRVESDKETDTVECLECLRA